MEEIRALSTGKITENIPKYRIYSAHDFQIANFMIALKPDYELNKVPYASTIKFELYTDQKNFYVATLYNGKNL